MAKSKAYWTNRAEQREMESQLIASKYLARMDESLRETQQGIIKQIEAFYGRYASDNQITLAEAKKYLTAKELKQFKNVDLKRFRSMAMEGNPDNENLLNAVSYRVRISRLEALNLQIEMQMAELYNSSNGLQPYTYTGLSEVYQNSYYQSMFGLAQAGVIGGTVAAITDKTMQQVLTYNWSGKEFSKRIWGHEATTKKAIQKELEKSFASGRSIQKTSKAIVKVTDVPFARAEALVRTEANFFHNLAAQNSYAEAGIEKYEILATLDSRTSDICRHQDGEIYLVKDYNPGVNASPFHVRCRTTTLAVFDDEYMDGEKRQSDDGLIDSMTYEEWAEKNIVSQKANVVGNQSKSAVVNQHSKSAHKTYEGIDRKVSDKLDGFVADLQNDYPIDFEYVGSFGGLERFSGQDLSAQRKSAYAFHTESTGNGKAIMAFNEKLNNTETVNSIKRSMGKGYTSVKNVDPLKYTVTHEFGHAVDDFLRNKGLDFRQSGIVEKFESDAEKFYRSKARLSVASRDLPKSERQSVNRAHSGERKAILNEYYKKELSSYGATNYSEFFAEAFAEYRLSPEPRGFAKMVGEFVESGVK